MKNFLFTVLLIMFVVLGNQAYGETKAVNEWYGDVLSHTIKCQSKDDFQISPLPGFLQVLISSKPIHQVRYLPIADIKQINYFDYGVYITWRTERMKNGRGYMTMTVFVPKEVKLPNEVMNIIKESIELKGKGKRGQGKRKGVKSPFDL
ncbi:MAG: hypothetical protein J7K85_04140 [Anaerolineaceae bacterium]|nr:hypothetical protein [Anaerolineaceae bacterium]